MKTIFAGAAHNLFNTLDAATMEDAAMIIDSLFEGNPDLKQEFISDYRERSDTLTTTLTQNDEDR